ncbi:MAG TPA: FlgD immunoglobulin-like domain containing protein [Spirochaetota bacterium]|jgi:outer membrane protein OmpA-like peptidoglycan-associated protein/flagellar hook assembly protein FlgD|nr:MAG: Outer membrane lipoprotein Omp16 precursor [Spirochaetes bacterium ADurb.Bin133]HNZ26996.1 FlgD immunoglobulin-like domain containing protein [Spirochaetota bacterium]HPY86878.1 FlgD immunoglobulin-like domain containing protein [Spirochaetota bacterium]
MKTLFLKTLPVIIMILLISGCKEKIPPEMIFSQNALAISPNNDGVMDELIIQSSVKTDNILVFWSMEILDEKGSVVYVKTEGGDLEKKKKMLFFGKNDYVKLPESVLWDGRDNNSKKVSDGKYNIRFILMDNKKNILNTEKLKPAYVFVDTIHPDAELSVENDIFSPNNDGNKDSLYINFKVKPDNLETTYDEMRGKEWKIDVIDNQNERLKTLSFNDKNELNKKVQWDGTDNSNNIVRDGFYSLKIYCSDKAGNYWEKIIPNIKVDTEKNPLAIFLRERAFSPNGDGEKDTIKFDISLKDKNSVEKWKFDIFSQENAQIKTFEGSNFTEDYLIWDGTNVAGNIMNDGVYKAKLEVVFINGSISNAESDNFYIDTIAPHSEIILSYNVFSPDGNNIKDFVIISQKTTSEEKARWSGYISDANSNKIRTYTWSREFPENIKWDGTDNEGTIQKDGDYFFYVTGVDLAGNKFTSDPKKISIYTAKNQLSITPLELSFSPNGDGKYDNMTFLFDYDTLPENPATDWKLSIYDSSDNVVFETNSTDSPINYVWNGKTTDETGAPDGSYTSVVSVNFFYGTTSSAKSQPFHIDLTPPEVAVDKDLKIFSPDGDGEADTITFSFSKAFDRSGFKSWKLLIINPITGSEFISFEGEGSPESKTIVWNGIGKKGALVESVQDYPVKVISEDTVGNVGETIIDPVSVDILVIKLEDGRYKIRISNINFKPEKAVMTEDKKNLEILDLLAKALKKYSEYKISIEGYANEYKKGLDVKWAYELSKNRAVAVRDKLVTKGIGKNRMETIGKGFENPIIPLRDKITDEERKEMSINRRVEFYLSK